MAEAVLSLSEAPDHTKPPRPRGFQQSDLPTLHRMQATAARVRDMIHRRAVVEYHAAFGSTLRQRIAFLDMCVIHNSLVGRETGRPWREVDYDHMRRAAWLVEQSFRPNRLVNDWYRRKCRS
jgi:hypothetical protein